MKSNLYLILVIILALNSAYSKSSQFSNQHFSKFDTKKSHQQAPEATSVKHTSLSNEKESHILHNDVEIKGDGTYHYDFETSNGIKRTEQGAVDGTIQGSSSYMSPEGIEIKTTFVADETGYHPVGDHIPQIPDYIVRALAYIRDHPYIEKDYYTGEVRKNLLSNNNEPLTTTTKRSAYNKNKKSNKKKSTHNSKNNLRH